MRTENALLCVLLLFCTPPCFAQGTFAPSCLFRPATDVYLGTGNAPGSLQLIAGSGGAPTNSPMITTTWSLELLSGDSRCRLDSLSFSGGGGASPWSWYWPQGTSQPSDKEAVISYSAPWTGNEEISARWKITINNQMNVSGGVYQFSDSATRDVVGRIPEPTAFAQMSLGGVLLLSLRWLRKQ